MTETSKQRLERIATQVLAGFAANPQDASGIVPDLKWYVGKSIEIAAELIRQVDERPPQLPLDDTRKGE